MLDRVDHRLDPLTDHDRLHLHHRLLLPFAHEKKASEHQETVFRGLDASIGRQQGRPNDPILHKLKREVSFEV
jgi:hypothetical protein